ncbi:MAG: peptidase M16 [Cyanobium sp. NAT70]|nr:peptidase M16 [Cyanobium sp. NAT70]|tara:strand:- start:21127 stop:22413 length:1287 start_codon:yes stop_codon:yes gene_type:complete
MELCHAVLNSLALGPLLNHWSLGNGVRCVEATMPDASLTCLDLWCRAGSSSEQHHEEGMAHFLEHMVFKGSFNLDAGVFDREIEALGGSSNAATGFDDVHFHVMIPADKAPRALDLLLDLVLEPTLAEDHFVMEREVVLEEIAQYADQPDERVLQELLARACPNHAYGRPILGWRSSLLAMDPGSMRAFHQRRYRGSNCCLSVAGKIEPDLRQSIEASALAGLPAARDTSCEPKERPLTVECGRHEIQVERLESARFLMLWPMAAAAMQTEVMGADLATTLLSEGRRSRLVAQLRETLRIADTADMDLTVLEQGSLVTLEICCQEDDLPAVEQEVKRQLDHVCDTPPEDWELKRARQLVGNALRFALESSAQVAGLAAGQTLWGRAQDLLQPLNELESWTTTRLQQELFPQLQAHRACTLIARPGAIS